MCPDEKILPDDEVLNTTVTIVKISYPKLTPITKFGKDLAADFKARGLVSKYKDMFAPKQTADTKKPKEKKAPKPKPKKDK